ncbi:MAG: hypothetical protein HEP71_19300 [Roseivirga sp.]|nr:hypothetical protein [Roseivirga sp.]
MKKRVPLFLVKLLNYEYWPFWLFFLPLVPYWVYLSIRARSFTYFTAANPGIEHSGVFGESKIDILKKIDRHYLPTTLFFKSDTTAGQVAERLKDESLAFPVIVKPNVGERGNEVAKIDNPNQLTSYLDSNTADFIIQEFVDFEIELGILYYKFPDESKSGITSIVAKEFLTLTGDGASTMLSLIEQSNRARLQLDSLKERFGNELLQVLPVGEKRNLEPIGNHCRGTKFLSGMNLLNDRLVSVFDDVSKNIEGFYFGRFDLKVKSTEDLYNGDNIKILELNGVTSEPAHIYDPSYSIWKAWSEAARNMKMMFRVCKANMKNGVKVTPFFEMFRLVRSHFGDNAEDTTVVAAKPSLQK